MNSKTNISSYLKSDAATSAQTGTTHCKSENNLNWIKNGLSDDRAERVDWKYTLTHFRATNLFFSTNLKSQARTRLTSLSTLHSSNFFLVTATLDYSSKCRNFQFPLRNQPQGKWRTTNPELLSNEQHPSNLPNTHNHKKIKLQTQTRTHTHPM